MPRHATAKMPLLSAVAAALVCFFLCFANVNAMSGVRDVVSDALDIGLASLIETPVVHHGDVFSQAIRIIHDYDRAPSCHRVATKALLDSCQSLEPADRSANLALDLVKSAFAARLAICELNGAGAAVPTECMSMIPKASDDQSLLCRSTGYHCDPREKSKPEFSPISQPETNACLRALESKPQWWTSYSNARQNAVLMCHAAREQIEHDQLLNTYRAMSETTEGLSAALAQSASESFAQLAKQKAFASAIQDFQAQLTKDLEFERRGARKIISNLANEVQAEWHSVFTSIFGNANTMSTKVDDINMDLDRAAQESAHIREILHNLLNNMAARDAELALAHRSNWETSQGLSVAVEDSLLKNMVTAEGMMVAMNEFRNDMNAIFSLISNVHTSHIDLQTRVSSLSSTFSTVSSQMDGLQSNIATFALTHNETLSNFRTELEGARALAAAFTESLAGLTTGGVAGLKGVLDKGWYVVQGLGLVVVVLFVDWLAGKSAARVVAVGALGLVGWEVWGRW